MILDWLRNIETVLVINIFLTGKQWKFKIGEIDILLVLVQFLISYIFHWIRLFIYSRTITSRWAVILAVLNFQNSKLVNFIARSWSQANVLAGDYWLITICFVLIFYSNV